MAYDLEEQESIDQMKAWWDQWGTPITADQTALVEDRLGDVYYAMNDFEKARAAWQKAVEAAGEQSPIRGVLHYKLASLPPVAE